MTLSPKWVWFCAKCGEQGTTQFPGGRIPDDVQRVNADAEEAP